MIDKYDRSAAILLPSLMVMAWLFLLNTDPAPGERSPPGIGVVFFIGPFAALFLLCSVTWQVCNYIDSRKNKP